MPVCASTAKPISPQAGWSGGRTVGQTTADLAQTDLTQCELILFTGKEWQTSQFLANAAPQSVDPAIAAAYFATAMVSVVTIWGLAHAAGRFLRFIRHG